MANVDAVALFVKIRLVFTAPHKFREKCRGDNSTVQLKFLDPRHDYRHYSCRNQTIFIIIFTVIYSYDLHNRFFFFLRLLVSIFSNRNSGNLLPRVVFILNSPLFSFPISFFFLSFHSLKIPCTRTQRTKKNVISLAIFIIMYH